MPRDERAKVFFFHWGEKRTMVNGQWPETETETGEQGNVRKGRHTQRRNRNRRTTNNRRECLYTNTIAPISDTLFSPAVITKQYTKYNTSCTCFRVHFPVPNDEIGNRQRKKEQKGQNLALSVSFLCYPAIFPSLTLLLPCPALSKLQW